MFSSLSDIESVTPALLPLSSFFLPHRIISPFLTPVAHPWPFSSASFFSLFNRALFAVLHTLHTGGSGRLAPLSARPCTACKANICGRRYENDSSGEEPDRSWTEDKWPPGGEEREGEGLVQSTCQMRRARSCNALK